MNIIPPDALNQHLIALGKTGSGKSSALRVLVEGALSENKRVCILDPKGDHYGIRLSANGKGAGHPVVVFGGEHADVPISPQAGAQVAELICSGNLPCIIDLGQWSVGERTRFFIDYAQGLFRNNKAPLTQVIDECHHFIPQGKVMDPDNGKMVHWANRLASEGRGKNIVLMAASQRPQKVHKDFVTSMETLIAMRVIHPLDRAAMKDWIDGAPDREKGKEVLDSLASMKRGEAWVWSPEIGYGPKRVTFPLFKTYDSFSPRPESGGALSGWAAVDLTEVKEKLQTVMIEAKANDPRELKAQLASVRAELEKLKKNSPQVVIKQEKSKMRPVRLDWQAQCSGEALSLLRALASGESIMECTLTDPEWKQCCCNCIFHKPTFEHCCVNTKLRDEKKTCICSIQNGWACCGPEIGRIYINWPEHSIGCECYTPKPKEASYEVPVAVIANL